MGASSTRARAARRVPLGLRDSDLALTIGDWVLQEAFLFLDRH